MSRSRPRQLFLHSSALSDAEYSVYVEALYDVLDEPGSKALPPVGSRAEDIESRTVSVREARAWMRGRYRDVKASEIDNILQMLIRESKDGPEYINGGQFLAALRLLMHARRGSEVNEGMVFIQADPSSPTTAHPPLNPSTGAAGSQVYSFPPTADPPTSELPGSTPATSHPPPPIHPASTSASSAVQPATRSQTRSNSNPFILGPAPVPTNSSTSNDSTPFDLRRASLSSAPASYTPPSAPPPVPPSSSKPGAKGSFSSKTSDEDLSTSQTVTPGSSNPFLQRSKTHSGAHGPGSGKLPPLPPRKPAHARRQGISARDSALSSSNSMPTVTPKLISPLMKQSLEASKQGNVFMRALEEAERARNIEVLKRSFVDGLENNRGRSMPLRPRVTPGPFLRDRTSPRPRPPRSESSMESFDQIASAHVRIVSPERLSSASSSSGASARAARKTPEHLPPLKESPSSSGIGQLPYSAPPTHPDRRFAGGPTPHHSHRRSPSYHSTSAISSYTSRSQPSQPESLTSPTEEDGVSPSTRTRATRSQSMNHHSPTTTNSPFDVTTSIINPGASGPAGRVSPPLPPPRRKRPESAQFGAMRAHNPKSNKSRNDKNAENPFFIALTESLKKKEEKEKTENTNLSLSSIQRSLSTLQTRAQPVLDRARYKAEAGLSRRGFMPHNHHNTHGDDGVDHLVNHGTGDTSDGNGDGGGMDNNLDVDSPTGSDGGEGERGRGRSAYSFNDRNREMDDLKLPIDGEGWRPL